MRQLHYCYNIDAFLIESPQTQGFKKLLFGDQLISALNLLNGAAKQWSNEG